MGDRRRAPEPQPLRLEFTVETPDQAAELEAAWREIVRGARPRLTAAEQELDAIAERASDALQQIITAIEESPGTGQAARLVRFLAGLYNGREHPFDLTELRSLDRELASACVDYTNFDRLAAVEVHKQLPEGEAWLHRWMREYELLPAEERDEE